MKVESFIPRLRIKEKNKLSKKRSITSFMTLKANIMTNNNKNQKNKFVTKERAFPRSLMGNASSAIKLNI
jgi:hypothetical protein